MKRLIDLFLRQKFTFAPEGAEKLGLNDKEKDTIFVVLVKYSQERILIGDTQMKKREVPGDVIVIPMKDRRTDKTLTTITTTRRGELPYLGRRQVRLSDILLAFGLMLFIYFFVFLIFAR